MTGRERSQWGRSCSRPVRFRHRYSAERLSLGIKRLSLLWQSLSERRVRQR